MRSANRQWQELVRQHPQLTDPNLWPPLPDAVTDRIGEHIVRLAAIPFHRTSAWTVRLLQRTRSASAALVVLPTFLIPFDWPGKHLTLYAIATVCIFILTAVFIRDRAWAPAFAAGGLGILAFVDCVAWLRIFDEVKDSGFPRVLAYIDVIAYGSIVGAAMSLFGSVRKTSGAHPSRWLYILFTSYCAAACYFWYLLAGPLSDSRLASKLRDVWDLDGYASSADAFLQSLGTTVLQDVEGLRFMAWLVWALYGISGTVSLALLFCRVSLRATVRWILIPAALYAVAGPWTNESWEWFRYLFLLLPLAGAIDWATTRSK